MQVSKTLIDHFTTRRSLPFPLMAAPGPDAGTLRAMLTIAARVPDHGKLAPWRFLVIGPERGAELGAFLESLAVDDDPTLDEARRAKERTRFTRAPLAVAVVSRARPHAKIPEWEQVLSAGAVALNLLHAAAAHGFGANWVTEWCAYDRRFLDHLGLAPDEKIAGFVHVGTPAGKPEDRIRPDLDTLITIL